MFNTIEIDSKEQFEKIIAENKRVVVKFWATWCRPCQMFKPHWDRAAEEVQEITFVAVDVDNNDWAMLDFGVRGVPTVKLYDDGTYVRDVKAPQGGLPFIKDITQE